MRGFRCLCPGITFLDMQASLSDNGVTNGDLLDVVYRPSKEEVLGPLRGGLGGKVATSLKSPCDHDNVDESSIFGLKGFRTGSL